MYAKQTPGKPKQLVVPVTEQRAIAKAFDMLQSAIDLIGDEEAKAAHKTLADFYLKATENK